MKIQNYLDQLKRDFDSCQLPTAHDPATQRTLITIAQFILNKEYTMSEFRNYVDTTFRFKQFHDGCINTVNDFILDNL